MATRTRPSKHITLAPDLLAQVEADAARLGVPVSEVIESHLSVYYAGAVVSERLDRLEQGLMRLQAALLPLAEKVTGLLKSLEQEGQAAPAPPVKVATYEEIYADQPPIGRRSR
jgi:hypothetical protein